MGFEEVNAYLVQAGYGDRVQEFDVSSATVELAAQALGCPPAHIAKTLSFMADGQPLLIVAAGDARVDNAKYKAQFHQKAKMMSAEELERFTGLIRGRVSLCHACAGAGVAGRIPAPLCGGVSCLRQRQQRGALVHPGAGKAQQAHGLGGRVQGLGVNQDE